MPPGVEPARDVRLRSDPAGTLRLVDPVLRADGLVKSVGAAGAPATVLDGVSLAVHAGEIVAVLGRRAAASRRS